MRKAMLGIQMIVSYIGPGEWCFTLLQNDQQINASHVVVGENGRTAVEYANGMNAQGQPVEGKGTFIKQ